MIQSKEETELENIRQSQAEEIQMLRGKVKSINEEL